MNRVILACAVLMMIVAASGCIGGDDDRDTADNAYDGTLLSLLLGDDDVPDEYFVCEGDDSTASYLTTFNTDNFGFSGVSESVFYRAIVNNGNGYTVAALYEWVVYNTSVNNETFDEIRLRFQEFVAAVESGQVPEGVPNTILEGTYTQYDLEGIGDDAYANVRIFSPSDEEYVVEANTTYYFLFEKEDVIVMLYGYNDAELGLEEYTEILGSVADRI